MTARYRIIKYHPSLVAYRKRYGSPNYANYRGTGMPYHQWIAMKILKLFLKEKRYKKILWQEYQNGDEIVIYCDD